MQREMPKCKMFKKHYNKPNPLGLGDLKDSIKRSPPFIRQSPFTLVPSPLMDPSIGQAFLKFLGGIIGRHVITYGFILAWDLMLMEPMISGYIDHMNQLKKCCSLWKAPYIYECPSKKKQGILHLFKNVREIIPSMPCDLYMFKCRVMS